MKLCDKCAAQPTIACQVNWRLWVVNAMYAVRLGRIDMRVLMLPKWLSGRPIVAYYSAHEEGIDAVVMRNKTGNSKLRHFRYWYENVFDWTLVVYYVAEKQMELCFNMNELKEIEAGWLFGNDSSVREGAQNAIDDCVSQVRMQLRRGHLHDFSPSLIKVSHDYCKYRQWKHHERAWAHNNMLSSVYRLLRYVQLHTAKAIRYTQSWAQTLLADQNKPSSALSRRQSL